MHGIGPAVGIPLFLSFLSCAGSPAPLEQLPFAAGGRKPWEAPREIEVLSWNLGFGGLGEGAEFYPDGGRRLIPSSRRDVLRYVAGIGAFLGQAEADLFLLQEAARPSAVNRRVDLLAELSARLPGRWLAWSPEVSIPFPRVSVGPATFAPGPPRAVERVALPGAKRWHAYHLLVARFPVAGAAGELVLANVHLSAFDEGALLRRRQLEAVTAFLEAEALRGSYVVLGGDWNLLLAETRFPHTTAERYLFWIHPLPESFPPPGWRLAADDARAHGAHPGASVRSGRKLHGGHRRLRGVAERERAGGADRRPGLPLLRPPTGVGAPASGLKRSARKRFRKRAVCEPARATRPARRTLGHDPAAAVAALGAQVDDPVRLGDHVQVVLDDHHRVARVHQPVQHPDQLLHVGHVQADGRLVEDVQGAARRRASWPAR